MFIGVLPFELNTSPLTGTPPYIEPGGHVMGKNQPDVAVQKLLDLRNPGEWQPGAVEFTNWRRVAAGG